MSQENVPQQTCFECNGAGWDASHEPCRMCNGTGLEGVTPSRPAVPNTAVGNPSIGYTTLETMRERGGKWAVYQNHDLGHPQVGHLQFLQYGGEASTYATPPAKYPDTSAGGIGWRYLWVGYVDLADGVISNIEQPSAQPVKDVKEKK